LTSSSLTSHAGFLPPRPAFLFYSYTLRKASLKSSHLYSTPLSLRTPSQEISYKSYLNYLKFILLKFKILTLLFTRLIFLEITNSTRACSLQPRLHPILISLMISSAFVNARSGNSSPLFGLFNNWTRMLSSVTPGISWNNYSLLCCLANGYPGGWNTPSGWEPVSVKFHVVEAGKPHLQAPLDQVACIRPPLSFIVPIPSFNPQALHLFVPVSQRELLTVYLFRNIEDNSLIPPTSTVPSKKLISLSSGAPFIWISPPCFHNGNKIKVSECTTVSISLCLFPMLCAVVWRHLIWTFRHTAFLVEPYHKSLGQI